MKELKHLLHEIIDRQQKSETEDKESLQIMRIFI